MLEQKNNGKKYNYCFMKKQEIIKLIESNILINYKFIVFWGIFKYSIDIIFREMRAIP